MQVQRKFRSDSIHIAPLETAGIFNVEMIPYCGQMSHGTWGCLAWVRWGPRSGGWPCWLSVSLCAGKYIAPLTEHESSGPQHPAHGGVTFPGILFMTWWVQGVTNGWLLVFLSRMCYHKASWAVVWLMAFQGVRRKPCLLSPVGGYFWSCLSRVYFSHLFLSFGFVGRILECRSVFWLVIIFLIGN